MHLLDAGGVVGRHHQQGIGEAAHPAAVAAAEARRQGNVCGIRLYVEHENTNAIKTYAKLGMNRTDYLLYEIDWS